MGKMSVNGKATGRPKGPRIQQSCEICGQIFEAIPSQAAWKKRCGAPSCSRKRRVEISCEICGIAVSLRPSDAEKLRTCGADSCKRALPAARAKRAYGEGSGIDLTAKSYAAASSLRCQRACVICDTQFVTHPKAVRKTCSKSCESQHRSNVRTRLAPRRCDRCGIAFKRRNAESRYCSDTCRMAALQALPRRRFDGPAGRTKSGYVRVRIWDGDTKRIIMEHRWVMEQALGRQLTRAEVVHHINGDRADNRLENLRLYATHSKHMKAEHADRARSVRPRRRRRASVGAAA